METAFDMGTLRGLLTAAMLLLFIGIVFWAYSRRRKQDFDALASMPLEDDATPASTTENTKDAS